MNSETRLALIMLAGLGLAVVGMVWLIVAAFRVGKLWGFGVLLLVPVLGPAFSIRHRRVAKWPLVLIAGGLVVGSAPIFYSRVTTIDLGPLERMVGDELHITLTSWDRKDYSILEARPAAVVLQMANPDVTDQTLAYLRGMKRLRELDLNGSQVDDEGLRELQGLPTLATLRLKDTKITDDGFRKWLAPRDSLVQLDLRGTRVTKESGKAWKDARPGRRLLQ